MATRRPILQRIALVGSSCAGKTTLSRALSKRLDLPHVELDALYWQPHWQSLPIELFRSRVEQAAAGDRWIIDGNYGKVSDLVWGRATDLIWLDPPLRVTFTRAWRRTLRRLVTRERLFAGNREKLDVLSHEWIPWWVLHTHFPRRRLYERMLSEPRFRHLHLVRLRGAGEVEAFLFSLGGADRSTGA